MNKLQTLLGLVLVVLIIGAIGLTGYNSYYWKYIAPTRTTVSTTYVDSLKYVENETYFIEVNHFSNDLKNGEEIFEVRLNYYTDPSVVPADEEIFKNVYSSGIQFIGTPTFEEKITKRKQDHGIAFKGKKSVEIIPTGNYTYYNTTNGTSYSAIHELGVDGDSWIVDFDGTIGLVKQKSWEKGWYHQGPLYHYYEDFTVMSFIQRLYASVESLQSGIHVLQFDLSKWFTGYVLDETGRRFETTEHAAQNWLFVNVKVNRNINGLSSASQSIFKRVSGKDNYVFDGQKSNDYWISNTLYNLTVNDFDYISYNGSTTEFLARLKLSAINFLREFNNLDIYVFIDLDSQCLSDNAIKLVGFAHSPYGILNVKQTEIKSNAPTTFKVYEQLKNIRLTNVSIEIIGGVLWSQ